VWQGAAVPARPCREGVPDLRTDHRDAGGGLPTHAVIIGWSTTGCRLRRGCGTWPGAGTLPPWRSR